MRTGVTIGGEARVGRACLAHRKPRRRIRLGFFDARPTQGYQSRLLAKA